MSTLYRDKKNTTQINTFREITMITHEEVVLLVESNPNDMKLGSKIRELYWYDRDKPYRNEDNLPDLPAQQTITEGTSVTSIDSQMEEVWTQIENEELQRFPGNTSRDYTLNPEIQLEIDFK